MTQIVKKVALKVKDDKTTLNKLFFYRGDGGLTLELSVEDWDYSFKAYTRIVTDLTHAQARMLIKDPNGEQKKIDSVLIQDGKIHFVIDKSMTNAVGAYEVYLQLISSDDNGRTTLPPFEYEVKPLPFDVIDGEYHNAQKVE